jgi:hypothetical protein
VVRRCAVRGEEGEVRHHDLAASTSLPVMKKREVAATTSLLVMKKGEVAARCRIHCSSPHIGQGDHCSARHRL